MGNSRRLFVLIGLIVSFVCFSNNQATASQVQVVLGNYSNFVLDNGQQVSGTLEITPASGTLEWTNYHVAGASAFDLPSPDGSTASSDAQSMTLIATANAPFMNSFGESAAWFRLGFEIDSPTGGSGSVLTNVAANYAAYFNGATPGWGVPVYALYGVSLEIDDLQGTPMFSTYASGGDSSDGSKPYSFDKYNEGTLSGYASLLYDTEYILKASVGDSALLPEPATMLLLGLGLIGLAGVRRKFNK